MISGEIKSTILQLLVFASIPFIVFLITHKTYKGYFQYIGLYQPNTRSVFMAMIASVLILLMGISMAYLSPEIKEMMRGPESVTGKLRASGLNAETIIVLLLIAWIKTALAEEILFRGFICSRLVHRFGFKTGNFLQALIFGLVHLLLFGVIANAGALFLTFAFLISGIAGYAIGYIKEKTGNGSVIPGWIAHGLGNTLAYFILAFGG